MAKKKKINEKSDIKERQKALAIFHKREQRFIWQFVKWRTAFNSFHHLPIKRKDEWRKLFGLTVTSEAARRIEAVTEAVWQPANNHANKLDISKWDPLPYNPFPVLKNLFKPASSSPQRLGKLSRFYRLGSIVRPGCNTYKCDLFPMQLIKILFTCIPTVLEYRSVSASRRSFWTGTEVKAGEKKNTDHILICLHAAFQCF